MPRLLNFIDAHSKEITTILDVGCFESQYLGELKKRGKIVDGIDIKSGEIEKAFLRNYFVGNAIVYPLGRYDLVVCLSTLEHAGIKDYRVDDFAEEQNFLFKKVVNTSKRFIYITFPYGCPAFLEGQFVNMTRNRLDEFLKAISKAVYKVSFYLNDKVQAGFGWTEIPQNNADQIQWDRFKGCRCVCILEVIL